VAARSLLAQLIAAQAAADRLNHVQCSIFQNAPKLRRVAANANAAVFLAETQSFELINSRYTFAAKCSLKDRIFGLGRLHNGRATGNLLISKIEELIKNPERYSLNFFLRPLFAYQRDDLITQTDAAFLAQNIDFLPTRLFLNR
jgi:hypothetical protein